MIFTRRWMWFFLFLAVLNEVIWRFFSTDFWVAFKTFGNLPLTLAFMASQWPMLKRHGLGDLG
jgi:intracellular septation protein